MLSKFLSSTQKNWPRRVLLLILLFALITRLFNLQYPKTYYFDEVYHAMTAKLVSRNDPRAYEWTHGDTIEPNTYVEWLHPPLAKYGQAAMILLVGETAVGWRLSSVFVGVGIVLLTTLLSQRLFGQPALSVLAGGLAALDGLLLTQSRIAMNDIHVALGFLVTLYVYVWYRQKPRYWRLLVVGLVVGLTVATKWSGVFAWAIVLAFEAIAVCWPVVHHWLTEPAQWRTHLVTFMRQSALRVVALLIFPVLIYVGSYLQMFIQGKDLVYFIELHQQIFWYQFNLDATHPYQSRPLEWVLDLRPVWYFVEYLPDNRRADIYNTGNPLIYWGGLIAAVVTAGALGLAIKGVFQQRGIRSSTLQKKLAVSESVLLSPMTVPPNIQFSLSLLLFTYLICWVPWLFSPRIMFSYHYAPAVPLLAMMIAYWSFRTWQWAGQREAGGVRRVFRIAIILYLILTSVFFFAWYPHWVGIPLSNSVKDSLYFAVESWR